MDRPSKESVYALKRFLSSPQGQEVMNYMRATPPPVAIDPSVHVYAHSNGIRVGWQKFADELEDLEGQAPQQRVQQDRLDH